MVNGLKRTVTDTGRLADIGAVMRVLAEHDPKKRGLQDVILDALSEELFMGSTFFQSAMDEGMEKGMEKGLGPLAHQFERRLGRPLTEDERATLRTRLDTMGPDKLGDVVLDVTDPVELEKWLEGER